jgi:signal transduction histidine kinase
MDFVEVYILFLQLIGILCFFLLCLLTLKRNQTRFRFEWFSISVLFFWVFLLCQLLILNQYNMLIVSYTYHSSLFLSSIFYCFFLFYSCKGTIERNLMGTIVISFIILVAVLLKYYSYDTFFSYFSLIYPAFCAISFHLLSIWSLRIQNERRGLILFWSWMIQLFFIVFVGINVIKNPIIPLPKNLRPIIQIFAQLLWFVVIYLMNESFWKLIKWIRSVKHLPYESLLKSLHGLTVLFGFLILFFFGHQINFFHFILAYVFIDIPILFFLYRLLQDKNLQNQSNLIVKEYRKFIAFNPNAAGLLDNTGQIELLNHAGEELFNISCQDAVSTKFDELVGKSEDLDWLDTILTTILNKRYIQFSLEIPIQNKAKRRNMKVTLYLLSSDDETSASNFVFSMIDETESKEQVTSKDQLLGLVSHELRTPLTIISESIQLLKKQDERANTNELQHQILDIATRNIEKMTNLIEQIVKMDKIKTGNFPYRFKKNNIHKLLKVLVSDYQIIAENKNLTFVLKLESRKEDIIFDELSMIEVVSNLIRNAIENTTSGTITIGTFAASREINVFVQDTGRGIREEDIPKIFDPFTPDLGLYICKTIIEDHGGQIFVESKLGKGSRFLFSLPG